MKRECIPALLLLMLVSAAATPCWAGLPVHINVKTILASQQAGGADPTLRSFSRSLQSVFKYSSYKLIGQNSLNLNLDQPGRVSLPGNREMTITPKGISGGRATLELVIYSRNRKSFQTVVKLLNQSSVTVGGPRFKDGYLLFNIYSSF